MHFSSKKLILYVGIAFLMLCAQKTNANVPPPNMADFLLQANCYCYKTESAYQNAVNNRKLLTGEGGECVQKTYCAKILQFQKDELNKEQDLSPNSNNVYLGGYRGTFCEHTLPEENKEYYSCSWFPPKDESKYCPSGSKDLGTNTGTCMGEKMAKKDFTIAPLTLEITVPGLELSSSSSILTTVSNYAYIPWTAEYVSAFYKFGVMSASILGIIMITIYGLQIIISGGGEKKMSAYKGIGRVAIGLGLTWSSYLILYTINPDLVNLKSLEINLPDTKEFNGAEALGEEYGNFSTVRCGGKAGNTQTLETDLGLLGDLYKYSSYSSFYGPTCQVKAEPKAIVLHYTASNINSSPRGVVNFFADESDKKGPICQILVGRDGKAYQITDTIGEKVICHGVPDGKYNWNKGGIGIEIMGANTTEISTNEIQKRAVIRLVKKIIQKYSIPKTNKVNNLLDGTGGIFTHQQITFCEEVPDSKIDPGEKYAEEIIKAIGGEYVNWKEDPRCEKHN